MKDYLYLFIGGRGHGPERSPEEMQQSMERWMAWIGRMREAGVYTGGNPLEDEGKTIAGADKVVTDGPFAEAKEIVGGYILVRTPSIDAAVEHALGCPIYGEGGRVEVRPVMELEGV